MTRIAVCLRFCVDVALVRADERTGEPCLDGAPWRVSTLDEHALEAVVRLKETHGGSVTALALVDREPPRELVLKVLAMGADEARFILDATAGQSDALGTASVLAEALRWLGGFELVAFGEGSIDRYDQQVGPRVAEALALPCVAYVTSVELEPGTRSIVADRLLEDRVETVRCALPAVITVGQEAPTPRLPSVLQVLGAGRKPSRADPVAALSTLGGASARELSRTELLDVHLPVGQRKRVRIPGDDPEAAAGELARLLVADGVVRCP